MAPHGHEADEADSASAVPSVLSSRTSLRQICRQPASGYQWQPQAVIPPVRELPRGTGDCKTADGATVAALGQLLWRHGGYRPASAVGHLYIEKDGEQHRATIRRRGGVAGFVKTHADVFVLEPAAPGSWQTCPTIRLLTPLESLIAAEKMRELAALDDAAANAPRPLCKFFMHGQCLKGADCRFSHDAPEKSEEDSSQQQQKAEDIPLDEVAVEQRRARIIGQVQYYLSDENLRRDAYFHSVIAASPEGWIDLSAFLSCRRLQDMGLSLEELTAALQYHVENGQQDLDSTSAAPRLELRGDAGCCGKAPALGSVVYAKENFESNSKVPTRIRRGCRGRIIDVDGDGDLEISFDGLSEPEWVFQENSHTLRQEEAVRRAEPLPPLNVAQDGWFPAAGAAAGGLAPLLAAVEVPAADALLISRPMPPLLRDLASGWQGVVEDPARRSFCFAKRSIWPAELLRKEFAAIRSNVDWHVLRSRDGTVTRSTAWFVRGHCSCSYTYGDVSVEPQGEYPAWLEAIEERVLGQGCGLEKALWPNCVNMNLYETEEQSVGWHSDDEALFRGSEMDCRIISASWGNPRVFEVAVKDKKHSSGRPSIFQESIRKIMLLPGDLCSMEGLFQRYYSHQISKGPSSVLKPPPALARINLTWRYIVKHKASCPCSI
eukprot:TRINITY_DN113752_c0_g1_i1.p1 TRINITY_DN113752_c0_g1~~TRINITY_DN113752_c0_g1_i1.p1  ORF type:complete len:662 (-),score=128.32 TRINITY_DN113752_c0_g1_i1:190-2175(-)